MSLFSVSAVEPQQNIFKITNNIYVAHIFQIFGRKFPKIDDNTSSLTKVIPTMQELSLKTLRQF